MLILLALTSCAARQDLGDRDADELAGELAERMAGEPRSCISATSPGGLTIADRRTVVSHQGGTLWVNRLERDCPGFRRLNTLIVEAHGSQYCRGDQVRALEAGSSIPGPICILGDFVPYRERD